MKITFKSMNIAKRKHIREKELTILNVFKAILLKFIKF